jgi:hypothetical protein
MTTKRPDNQTYLSCQPFYLPGMVTSPLRGGPSLSTMQRLDQHRGGFEKIANLLPKSNSTTVSVSFFVDRAGEKRYECVS